MLQISTTAVCPKCGGTTVCYEDGKFTCHMCGRKYTSKEIVKTHGNLFEIATAITEKEVRDKIKPIDQLTQRFSAVCVGYEPCSKGVGHLSIGWEDGYPVRLNMMAQELNEILD